MEKHWENVTLPLQTYQELSITIYYSTDTINIYRICPLTASASRPAFLTHFYKVNSEQQHSKKWQNRTALKGCVEACGLQTPATHLCDASLNLREPFSSLWGKLYYHIVVLSWTFQTPRSSELPTPHLQTLDFRHNCMKLDIPIPRFFSVSLFLK